MVIKMSFSATFLIIPFWNRFCFLKRYFYSKTVTRVGFRPQKVQYILRTCYYIRFKTTAKNRQFPL